MATPMDEDPAASGNPGPSAPPPEDWRWPHEHMKIEVEIEGPDGELKWVPATVGSVHLDSLFSAEIQGDEKDTWVDWFTWEEEGTDWRRINPNDGFLLAEMQAAAAAAAAAAAEATAPSPSAAPSSSAAAPSAASASKKAKAPATAAAADDGASAEAKAAAKAEAAEKKAAREAEKAPKEAEKAARAKAKAEKEAEKEAKLAEREAKAARKAAREAEPKKPLSAYIIYTNEHRQRVKEENPEATVTELITMLGAGWKALSDEERAEFEQKAEADKERYNAECVACGLGHPDEIAAEKAAAKAAEKAAAAEERAAERAKEKEAMRAKREEEKAAAKEAATKARERARASAKAARAIDKRDVRVLTAEDEEGNPVRVKLRLDMSRAPPKITKKRLREVQERLDAFSAAAAAEAAQATIEFWQAATSRLPKTACYEMRKIGASRDLSNCVLLAPSDRVEWFLVLGELMALTEEATRRHGEALRLDPLPTPMPTAYVAQRLDFDDPLWGWQARDKEHGWLMGVVTLTTFTTWSADFEWNSDAVESGLPAARLFNAWLRNGEPIDFDHGFASADKDQMTVKELALSMGVEAADLVRLNKADYKSISALSKLALGTQLRVCEDDEADFDHAPQKGDTPELVAERHGLPVDALVAINREQFGPKLNAETPLKGEPLKLRDRDNEVSFEYLMSAKSALAKSGSGTEAAGDGAVGKAGGAAKGKGKAKAGGKKGAAAGQAASGGASSSSASASASASASDVVPGLRRLDEDGSLTAKLRREERNGDPTREGVVWPRIAEVGLLVSLGGGGTLLRFALQKLQDEGFYHFAACQATLAAVGFYERVGFVRVGAVARYAPKGTSEEELRQLPVCGYQHWQDADELMEEADFGQASYLMVLDLSTWQAGKKLDGLSTTSEHPKAISPMEGAPDLRRMAECTLEGGHLAYESGDGVVVSLTAECVAGRLDASALRMEIRYEVEEIIAQRGTGSTLEYKVKWAKWREATWEPAENMVGAAEALEAFAEKRKLKKQRKSQGGDEEA